MGFSPEAEDVEGVVQECDTALSPDVDSKDKGDNKAENHNLNTGNCNQHQTSRIHACARYLTQVISLPRYHRVDSGNSWLTRYEVDMSHSDFIDDKTVQKKNYVTCLKSSGKAVMLPNLYVSFKAPLCLLVIMSQIRVQAHLVLLHFTVTAFFISPK